MLLIGTSYSDSPIARKAAEEASHRALKKAGISKAAVAILFASVSYKNHFKEIVSTIKKITGVQTVVGTSAFGVLSDGCELEHRFGLSLMLIESEQIIFKPFLVKNLQESNYKAAEAVAQKLKDDQFEANAMMLFPDIYSFQSQAFFDGFEMNYGYVPFFGGASSEDGKEEKTYQIVDDEVAFDAVAGLALGGNIRVVSSITKSCTPFGEPIRVTRAEGNTIYEMDGRPAYELLLESASRVELQNKESMLQNIFLGLPLRSFQTDFSNSNYLIRNITSVNAQKGMLSCISPVTEGDYVTFAVRNAELASSNLRNSLESLKDQVDLEDVRFGFYFNSCARGQSLYRYPGHDVQMIRRYFPKTPVAGFFSYAELMPLDHINLLHHHSGVLNLICEDQKYNIPDSV